MEKESKSNKQPMNCVNSDYCAAAASPEITDLNELQLAPHSDPKTKVNNSQNATKDVARNEIN